MANQRYIIVKDRVEIYKDFTLNLLYYIIDYYQDPVTFSTDEVIKNYFNWCFNKVCDEFKKEGIDFSSNNTLREYFYQFYYHQFFKLSNNEATHDSSQAFYEKLWKNIFEIDKQKNKSSINTLIEIYNVFDTSVSKEKNILEIV